MLALLALHPEGLIAEQLAPHVYGEEGNPTTIRADTATRLCRDVLLAQSESPTVRAEWDELLVALRQAVLNRGQIGPLWSFGQAPYGQDDLEVFERLVGWLPRSDPRHTMAAANCSRLRAEDWAPISAGGCHG